MSVLVIDVGTTSVRATVVTTNGELLGLTRRPLRTTRPAPGFIEFDAAALAEDALSLARSCLEAHGPVAAVAVANQRASAVLFDARSGAPVGPGISWQDLRTAGWCLSLQRQGLWLAPNATATKLAVLLDLADPTRTGLRPLLGGTIDTFLAWHLSAGELRVTDAGNAGVTGLVDLDATGWDDAVLDALRVPRSVLPEIVDSTGVLGRANALDGAPPIAGISGDQQASLIGQGAVRRGLAKITFGTGGMLDCCLGTTRPSFTTRGEHGSLPIVAWRDRGVTHWGAEAVLLSAGSCLNWLVDDLGILASPADSDALASSVKERTGVVFVPALVGLGSPSWDFGARSVLLGLSEQTSAAEVVRAVLEGLAQRGADLLEAAEADTSLHIDELGVDGGLSGNATFVQLLADATQRPIGVSAVAEATSLGAAFLAGTAVGLFDDLDEAVSARRPESVVEPRAPLDRDRFRAALERARGQVPELSGLRF